MTRPIVAIAVALSLGACSTMDVKLAKTGDGPSVSAIAKAPTYLPMVELIRKTNQAMTMACEGDSSEANALPKTGWVIGKLTKLADDFTKLLETVKGWIPMNTYTAARTCGRTAKRKSENAVS